MIHRRPDGSSVAKWAALATVSPDYFHTPRIPLLRGRTFAEQEFMGGPGESPVVLVNQALARALFTPPAFSCGARSWDGVIPRSNGGPAA
jgi:hypothetical protein